MSERAKRVSKQVPEEMHKHDHLPPGQEVALRRQTRGLLDVSKVGLEGIFFHALLTNEVHSKTGKQVIERGMDKIKEVKQARERNIRVNT